MLDGRWRRGHDPNLPGVVGMASHASLSRPWPPASLPRSAHGCRSRFLLWPESLALSLGAHRHTRLQHSTTQLRLFAGQRGMSAYVPSALIGRPHPLYACIRALTPPLHHSFSSNASPPQFSSNASPPQLSFSASPPQLASRHVPIGIESLTLAIRTPDLDPTGAPTEHPRRF